MLNGEESMGHVTFLEDVARADVNELRRKECTYRGSWKKRGGVGAFMMLARKWDRLESIVSRAESMDIGKYDIFDHIAFDPSGDDGTALAEIRDLRRYLTLVEAEMISRGIVKIQPYAKAMLDENVVLERPEYDGPEMGPFSEIPCVYTLDPRSGTETKDRVGYFVVDRRQVRMKRAERFAVELNDKEHELTPPWIRGLYEWRDGDAPKWIMREEFRKEWGK